MKAKRKYEKSKSLKTLYGAYYLFTGFGQRGLRSLKRLIFIILIFSIFSLINGFQIGLDIYEINFEKWKNLFRLVDFLNSIFYSIYQIIPFEYSKVDLKITSNMKLWKSTTRIIHVFYSIVSLVLISFSLLSLKRYFKRH